MITGRPKRVKEYAFIDRCSVGESFVVVTKGDMEEIIGYPYRWYGDQSLPFLAHIINGSVVRTVNALDLSWIQFDTTYGEDVYPEDELHAWAKENGYVIKE